MEQIAMLNGLDSRRRRRRRRKSSAMGFLGEGPDDVGSSNTGYIVTFAIFVAIAYVFRPGQEK